MNVTMSQFTLIFGIWMGISLGEATVDEVYDLLGQYTGADISDTDLEFLISFLDHKAPSSVVELCMAQMYAEAHMHYAIFSQSKYYTEACSFLSACNHYFEGRTVAGHC